MAIPPIIQGSAFGLLNTHPATLNVLRKSKLFTVVNPPGDSYDFKLTGVVVNNNTTECQDIRIQTLQKCIYRTGLGIKEPCFETSALMYPHQSLRLDFLHSCNFQLQISRAENEVLISPEAGVENEYGLADFIPRQPLPEPSCSIL